MTVTYCLDCKTWAQEGEHDCDCADGEIPVFKWAWAYKCNAPGCLWTGDTHHEAGQHWQEEGHTDYEPMRRIIDLSETITQDDLDQISARLEGTDVG